MHARSHALFVPVATSAVRWRRRMCYLLPPSWIHAPRPYTTDSAPTPLPPPPPPTRPAVTSTPQDTEMADWDVCEPDGVASMSVGDTEQQMGIGAQDAAPLAAHVAPTVDMEAIEARSDISGAAPWPLRCPRQDAPSEAVAATPPARPRGVPSEAVAAAPLARPREEEARACVTVECVRASRANCFRAHRLKPPSLNRSWSMTIAPLAMSTRCLSQSRRFADAWRRSRPIRSPRRGERAQRRSPRTRIGTLGPGATIVLGGDGAT